MAAMRNVVKSTRKYLDAPALKGFLGARYGASATANTDAEIDEFIKGYCGSFTRFSAFKNFG